MNQQHLILIGYRATGKTSLAGKLGEKLACAAMDTDVAIVQKAGISIAELFAVHGEEYFRNLEAEVLEELLCRETMHVFATGGGAPLRESNRKLLKQAGFVVWLKAAPETIHRRMSQDPKNAATRPSLTTLSPQDEIVRLLDLRTPVYRETAHVEIDTDTKTLDEMAREVLALYTEAGFPFRS